jgi:hypothetical protein
MNNWRWVLDNGMEVRRWGMSTAFFRSVKTRSHIRQTNGGGQGSWYVSHADNLKKHERFRVFAGLTISGAMGAGSRVLRKRYVKP